MKKIILLIEDNPAERGAPHVNGGKPRQLEYACVAQQSEQGPVLTVRAVRDTITRETITDTDELPPLEVVIEAARLYDWSWVNQDVFGPGIPMVPTLDGRAIPFKASKAKPASARRAPRRRKAESPDGSPPSGSPEGTQSGTQSDDLGNGV